VGVECYDHPAFPAKYRGCLFLGDWSIGVIWAVHLERVGATYKAKAVDKFCVGAPMNVTDLAVAPDGALVFSMGGRGSPGRVHRLVADKPGTEKSGKESDGVGKLLAVPQPLAAWSRADQAKQWADLGTDKAVKGLTEVARKKGPTGERLRALALLQEHGKG